MPILDILAYIGAATISKIIEVAVAPTEVAVTPATTTHATQQMSEPSKHDLVKIKARATAAHLKGPYESPPSELRRSERLAAKRDYVYKGKPTKFHIFGALFYNGYRTFSISGSEAHKVAFEALADQHHTVALHDCTLADATITLKVGTSPDPHRLISEKLGPGKARQYMVNAAGHKNGFYKEWTDRKLVVSERFKEGVRY